MHIFSFVTVASGDLPGRRYALSLREFATGTSTLGAGDAAGLTLTRLPARSAVRQTK